MCLRDLNARVGNNAITRIVGPMREDTENDIDRLSDFAAFNKIEIKKYILP